MPEGAPLFGISYPQFARWVNGENLPYKGDDPRNPWPQNGPGLVRVGSFERGKQRAVRVLVIVAIAIHEERGRRIDPAL